MTNFADRKGEHLGFENVLLLNDLSLRCFGPATGITYKKKKNEYKFLKFRRPNTSDLPPACMVLHGFSIPPRREGVMDAL